MGEFLIQGTGVVEDLERIVSCSVKDIKIGGCRYGLICNEQGGVIDDQILYRLEENKFFMVVNASTQPGDFQWIKEHLSENSSIENLSDQTAKVDIQGPWPRKYSQNSCPSQLKT
jgi:aminomethyltransferase